MQTIGLSVLGHKPYGSARIDPSAAFRERYLWTALLVEAETNFDIALPEQAISFFSSKTSLLFTRRARRRPKEEAASSRTQDDFQPLLAKARAKRGHRSSL